MAKGKDWTVERRYYDFGNERWELEATFHNTVYAASPQTRAKKYIKSVVEDKGSGWKSEDFRLLPAGRAPEGVK